jgi:hypothetical protein
VSGALGLVVPIPTLPLSNIINAWFADVVPIVKGNPSPILINAELTLEPFAL